MREELNKGAELPSASRPRRSSKKVSSHSEEKYSFESSSESGKDFSPDAEDEDYVLPPKKTKEMKTRSLRGINAHRYAISARSMAWDVQSMNTDAPADLPVVQASNRGQSRGRGWRRGRFGTRRESRNEMLIEHRQLVGNLEEEEAERESQQERAPIVPKLPPLKDGNLSSVSSGFECCERNLV